MGFYKTDFEIMDFLKKDGLKCKSVLEFGSQDIREDRNGNLRDSNRISTQEVYKNYGFSRYQCIDMDGGHNALAFDLGKNLQEDYGFLEQFDLVTIKEIGHWIFDQKTLFCNIYNATKEGGYIIWRSPIVGGYGAGCFTYMPNKMLQLGFCNNFLFRTAWIYEQVSGVGGRFVDGSEIYNVCELATGKATYFLQNLKEYTQRQDSKIREVFGYGQFMRRLTMVFKKLPSGGGHL